MGDYVASLAEITDAIGSGVAPNEVLSLICRIAVDQLRSAGVSAGLICCFNHELTASEVRAEWTEQSSDSATIGRSLPVLASPLIGELLQLKRPLTTTIADAERLGRLRHFLIELGARSAALISIASGDRTIGYLCLASHHPSINLSDAEAAFAEALSSQAAATVRHETLIEEAQIRATQLDALRRATLELASLAAGDERVPRPTLLSVITQRAVELLHATSGGIYDYDPHAGLLTVVADHNRPSHRGRQLRVGQGMAGRLIQSGASHAIEDDYRIWGDRSDVYGNDAFQSVIEVPLRWLRQTIGVLYIDDRSPRRFTAADAELLRQFADQAAIVLASADQIRKGTQAAQAVGDLETLRTTVEAFKRKRTGSLEDQLTRIAKEFTTLVNAEVCRIFVVHQTGILTLEASSGQAEGSFKRGLELEVRSGPQTGLIGHIAFTGEPFNEHGEALTGHFAVRGLPAAHLTDGRCHSLLALPLFREPHDGALAALVQLDNKRGPGGDPASDVGFSQIDVERARLLAEAVVAAIEIDELVAGSLAERQDLEAANHRSSLLDRLFATVPRLQVAQPFFELVDHVVKEATDLLGYHVGYLYECDGQANLRELASVERAAGLAIQYEPASRALAALVVQSGAAQTETASVVVLNAVPIRLHGQLQYTLVVAMVNQLVRFPTIDRRVLELFATRVATVFHESRARNFERRLLERATTAQRVTEYILHSKDTDQILWVLLTVATAGYGYALNRAAVLLFDRDREFLEGRCGVGHRSEQSARMAWHQHDDDQIDSLEEFITHLETTGPVRTPIDERVGTLRMPVSDPAVSALIDAIRQGPSVFPPNQLKLIPEDLARVFEFEPTAALVVVPLARGNVNVGLLVGDNAITRAALSDDELKSLSRLASAAAIAIDQLEWPRDLTPEQLHALEEVAKDFDGLEDHASLAAIEQKLVTGALELFNAHAVMFWSYDQTTDTFNLRACAGRVTEQKRARLQASPPRRGQTTYTVQTRGWLGVDDLEQFEDHTRDALADIGTKSFQGVSLHVGGERLGVLYINYDFRRSFTDADRDALVSFARDEAVNLKKARAIDQVLRAKDTRLSIARLSAFNDLKSTLRSIVDEARSTLKCDAVTLYEYSEETDLFTYPPTMDGVRDTAGVMRQSGVKDASAVRLMLRESRARFIEDAPNDDFIGGTRFRQAEEIHSCVAVPLRNRDKTVGVLFLNYRAPRRFTADERSNIDAFVEAAGAAVRSAQFYTEIQRESQAMEASYPAQAVTGSLDFGELLDGIAEQAFRLATMTSEEPTFASVTVKVDSEADALRTYPPTVCPLLRELRVATESGVHGGAVGLVGQTLEDGKTRIVKDIRTEAKYVPLAGVPGGSLIVVPIRIDEKVVGAIDVEHPAPGRLRPLEVKALQTLAHHAGVTIKNAQLHRQVANALERERKALELANAGMVERRWVHDMPKSAITMTGLAAQSIERLRALHNEISGSALPERLNGLPDELVDLWFALGRIQSISLRFQRPLDSGPAKDLQPITIHDFLASIESELFDQEHKNVRLELKLSNLSRDARVQANPGWLQEVFRILMNNAYRAMADEPAGLLRISARSTERHVEIDVMDNGKGLAPHLKDVIFEQDVEKTGQDEGLGMGLRLARSTARIYGGDVRFIDPQPGERGATFRAVFPLMRSTLDSQMDETL